MVQLIKLMAIS